MNTAGQWSPPVSGSIPMKRSAMRFPLLVALRVFARSQRHPAMRASQGEGTGRVRSRGLCAREGAFLPLSKAWLCVTLLVLGHPVALAAHVTVGVLQVGYAADPVSVIA
jgi:hypothetical protein